VVCHEDPHRESLGDACEACHDATAWKPAPLFDHSRSRYPLDGGHVNVPCGKCHPPVEPSNAGLPATLRRFKPVAFAECSDCHRDPHESRLGADCSRCHVTLSFRQVEREAFAHDRTRYPLRGRHRSVSCERCHDPVAAWGARPPSATCAGCHRDPHGRQLETGGARPDCGACHGVDGWAPSTFTVERHRTSAYPLEGKHATVACRSCHPKQPPSVATDALGTAAILIRRAHERCTDCHGDAHAGQLAGRPGQGACEGCHALDGWRPSTFTVDRHDALGLPLLGRHREIECAACHGPEERARSPLPAGVDPGTARVVLALPDTRCVACHHDPHDGRFEPQGERPESRGCPGCHTLERFRPSAVDVARHAAFGYRLEGAHLAVPCVACHRELELPSAASSLIGRAQDSPRLRLAAKHDRCEDCHADPHAGQFATRGEAGRCESCHDVHAFRPAGRFDHDRDSDFPLRGAHAGVPCAKCHPSLPGADGRAVVTYTPVSRECESCHGGQRPLARGAAVD